MNEQTEALKYHLIQVYGYWGDYPNYCIEEWRHHVANGDTRLGYWEWAANGVVEDEENKNES